MPECTHKTVKILSVENCIHLTLNNWHFGNNFIIGYGRTTGGTRIDGRGRCDCSGEHHLSACTHKITQKTFNTNRSASYWILRKITNIKLSIVADILVAGNTPLPNHSKVAKKNVTLPFTVSAIAKLAWYESTLPKCANDAFKYNSILHVNVLDLWHSACFVVLVSVFQQIAT